MSESDHRESEIVQSWSANANAWTRAVREGRIPSRVASTDQAILDAVRRRTRGRVLDAGCGEGWLARALETEGFEVVGIDATEELITRARELGGGVFSTLAFEDIIAAPKAAGGPYEVIVLNFALLGERVAPLLSALGSRLRPDGRLILQTVHPWSGVGEAAYRDGWRVETFDAFGGEFPAPMPWFFRTMEGWLAEISTGGLIVDRLEEPVHPDTGLPASLLLTMRRGARQSRR
jgi:2-polyprenyl-3-methyl-5-hydroxy-6-metoxy-1,4-benzoquinol methylase